jgi:hypothetical protein
LRLGLGLSLGLGLGLGLALGYKFRLFSDKTRKFFLKFFFWQENVFVLVAFLMQIFSVWGVCAGFFMLRFFLSAFSIFRIVFI